MGGELCGGLLGAAQGLTQRALLGHHLTMMLLDGPHHGGVAAAELLDVVEPGEQIVEATCLENGVQDAGAASFVGRDQVLGKLLLRQHELIAVEAQRGAVGGDLRPHEIEALHGGGVVADRPVELSIEPGDLGDDRSGPGPGGRERVRRGQRRNDKKDKGRKQRNDECKPESCAHEHRIASRSADRRPHGVVDRAVR